MVLISRALDLSKLWQRSWHLGDWMHDGRTCGWRCSVSRRIWHWSIVPYLENSWTFTLVNARNVLSEPFFHWLQVPWCVNSWDTWGTVCRKTSLKSHCSHVKNVRVESLRSSDSSWSFSWSLFWRDERTRYWRACSKAFASKQSRFKVKRRSFLIMKKHKSWRSLSENKRK